ncbi:MAG: hypothetical protein JO339_32420 [Alphaproteobacteria bacterium]|nr:hypothetical protein [Alphaproteobacteria bacterium]
MTSDQRPLMVALEERLATDKDQTELRRLLAELDGYAAQAKKTIDGGLPPHEFRFVSKYCAALAQARDAANLAWELTVRR